MATPSTTRPTSSGTPMTPVEQTSTCSARQPSSAAARSTVASTAPPAGPGAGVGVARVQHHHPGVGRAGQPVRDQTTGAAATWLVVNIPAATVPGSPTRARSGAPDALSPQATPAAPNPAAAVTPSRRSTRPPPDRRPRRLPGALRARHARHGLGDEVEAGRLRRPMARLAHRGRPGRRRP